MRKTMAGNGKRRAARKAVATLTVSHLISLENMSRIASRGLVIEASATGLLLRVKRTEFVPKHLRETLDIAGISGQRVLLHIYELNLDISGVISRTQIDSQKSFKIAVDFSDDAPDYWRECLIELLPTPKELIDSC